MYIFVKYTYAHIYMYTYFPTISTNRIYMQIYLQRNDCKEMIANAILFRDSISRDEISHR